jgi:hypothetical protein
MKAIVTLALRYPEPTEENCTQPNTQILLDIQDEFWECEDNPEREALFEAIWRMFIVEYEHDPYYRHRIDWMLEKIAKSNWTLRPEGEPSAYWKE